MPEHHEKIFPSEHLRSEREKLSSLLGTLKEPHTPENFPTVKDELLSLGHHEDVEVTRVQADIDKVIFDYLFTNVVPHVYGSRQAIIHFFFKRLYKACLDAGIPPHWDDEGERKFVDLLKQLNFNERRN